MELAAAERPFELLVRLAGEQPFVCLSLSGELSGPTPKEKLLF